MVTRASEARAAARKAARKAARTRKKSAARDSSKPAASKPVSSKPVSSKPVSSKPVSSKPGSAKRRQPAGGSDMRPRSVPGLSEEDQIREAKYLPRALAMERLEEERFVLPDTYGVNRVRLLVRDPEWIFAHWDVSPEAMKELVRSLGERALALSQLTLRVVDAASGAVSDILLPPGARWWYVRTEAAPRKYRAELGVTLASGEFCRLAWSNSVVTPRVGPSPATARRLVSYARAGALPSAAAEEEAAAEAPAAEPGPSDGSRR